MNNVPFSEMLLRETAPGKRDIKYGDIVFCIFRTVTKVANEILIDTKVIYL